MYRKVLVSSWSQVQPRRFVGWSQLVRTAPSTFLVSITSSWWLVSSNDDATMQYLSVVAPQVTEPSVPFILLWPPVSPTNATRSSTVGSTMLAWILYAFVPHERTGFLNARRACMGKLQQKESSVCECCSRTLRGNAKRGKGNRNLEWEFPRFGYWRIYLCWIND